MKVKVVNLNIWHGGWRLWDNIIEYLKKEQPDILMLQEAFMSEDVNAEPYMRTVEALRKEIDLPHHVQAAEFNLKTDHESGPLGNAIMSRFPLLNPRVEIVHGSNVNNEIVFDDHPELFASFPRNVIHAQVDIEQKIYNIMTTHGAWAPDGTETDAQKAMGKKISEYLQGKSNVILSGDFNVNENTEFISGIEKDLLNIFKGERISSFNMKHKNKLGYASAVVDFVFSSPNLSVLEHRTSDADVSDHQSQVVVFNL